MNKNTLLGYFIDFISESINSKNFLKNTVIEKIVYKKIIFYKYHYSVEKNYEYQHMMCYYYAYA